MSSEREELELAGKLFPARMLEKIKRYQESRKPTTLVLSYSTDGLMDLPSLLQQSTYARSLWQNLPEIVQDNVPIKVQINQPQYAHKIDERNWGKSHAYYSTREPNLIYHSLGAGVPGEGGAWVDFFTVNLTPEQLQELTKGLGAKLPKNKVSPLLSSTPSIFSRIFNRVRRK